MKQKITNLVIAIAIIHTLSIAITGILKIEHISYPIIVSYLINFVIECTYVITLLYLRYILIYVNEKPGIILALWAYIIYDAFAFLLRMFVVGTSVIHGNWILNIASVAVTIYFIIKVYQVGNAGLAKSFKVLAMAILFSVIIRVIAGILFIQHYVGRSMLWYMVAAELLPPLAILFILYKISIYLNHEQQIFKRAALSADEPA